MVESRRVNACPRLWNSVFLDKDGRVYACCHYLPQAMGDIRYAPLEQIRKGPAASELRRAALTFGTACFDSCSILTDDERDAAASLDSTDIQPLERLHVLFGEGCRLACVMCNQDHRSAEMLDSELVLRHATPDAETSIEIQGGEPLQLKESRAYLAAIIKMGRAPTIITNGLQLDGSLGNEVVRGCSRIKISINAATRATHEAINRGSSWDRVIGNIRNAVKLKRTLSRAARLVGRMTLVPQNLHEVGAFMRLCLDLGMDAVEYGYDARTLPSAIGRDPEMLQKLRDEVRAAHADCSGHLSVQIHRLAAIGLWPTE